MARRKVVVIDENEGENADQDKDGSTLSNSVTVEERDSDSEVTSSLEDGFVPEPTEPLSHVEVVEATPKRGRPAGSGVSRPRVPKATPNEIAQAAPLIVGLTNQVVVSWAGPECAMLQTEANFLTPSVGRVLSRLPRGAAQQVSLYTDPFIILTALGLWATRIAKIKENQAKAKYVTTPYEQARAVGESGTEFHADQVPSTESPIASPPKSNGVTEAIFRARSGI